MEVESEKSAPTTRAQTVRLPYSLVPGMDLCSRAYLKASALLSSKRPRTDAGPVSEYLDGALTRACTSFYALLLSVAFY